MVTTVSGNNNKIPFKVDGLHHSRPLLEVRREKCLEGATAWEPAVRSAAGQSKGFRGRRGYPNSIRLNFSQEHAAAVAAGRYIIEMAHRYQN
jgi:hypothetical protein